MNFKTILLSLMIIFLMILIGKTLASAEVCTNKCSESSKGLSNQNFCGRCGSQINKEGNKVKRVYRSKHDKIIAGVCGGIGNYFGVDPVIIRLGCVLSVFLGGAGVVAYIVAWFIIPLEPDFHD